MQTDWPHEYFRPSALACDAQRRLMRRGGQKGAKRNGGRVWGMEEVIYLLVICLFLFHPNSKDL